MELRERYSNGCQAFFINTRTGDYQVEDWKLAIETLIHHLQDQERKREQLEDEMTKLKRLLTDKELVKGGF